LPSIILISAAVLAWRYIYIVVMHGNADHTYYATDSRMDSILYGAMLAGLAFYAPRAIDLLAQRSIFAWAAFGLILFSLVYRNVLFREVVRFSVQGMALIPIFASLLFSQKLWLCRAVLCSPLMVWIGAISYSLYVWHELAFFIVTGSLVGTARLEHWQVATALALTILLATVCYYFVERPLRYRRKMISRREKEAGQEGPPKPATTA